MAEKLEVPTEEQLDHCDSKVDAWRAGFDAAATAWGNALAEVVPETLVSAITEYELDLEDAMDRGEALPSVPDLVKACPPGFLEALQQFRRPPSKHRRAG